MKKLLLAIGACVVISVHASQKAPAKTSTKRVLSPRTPKAETQNPDKRVHRKHADHFKKLVGTSSSDALEQLKS